MTIRLRVLSACVLVAAIPSAWANGGGAMSMPEIRAPREQTPEEQAKALYNQGVHDVKKADKYQASSAQQTKADKKERALHEAQEYYSSALAKFQQAVQSDPRSHEAWNYVGYTNRKLGTQIFVGGELDPINARETLARWRVAAHAAHGHLRLLAAALVLRSYLDFFDQPPAGAFKLMRRLKTTFDPAGIFNPGCFVGGL